MTRRSPTIDIDRALLDPHLLGAALGKGETWSRWLAVLRAAFALPMSEQDRVAFREVAGDRPPPARRVNELWAVVGRRSGKTRMAAAISVFIGAIEQHKLAPGEIGYVLLLAASRDQASVAFQYVLGFLQASPILRQQIVRFTASEVRLRGNIVIGVHAGSYRTIRGRTLLAVVGDETSFWRDESSAQPDIEIYRAVLPALAASKGMWIGISTGYRKLGLLYQKWRDHFGQSHDDILVIQGASEQFNQTLDQAMIARAKAMTPRPPKQSGAAAFVRTSVHSSMTKPSSASPTTAARSKSPCAHAAPTAHLSTRAAVGTITSASLSVTARAPARARTSSRMWSAASPRRSILKVSSPSMRRS